MNSTAHRVWTKIPKKNQSVCRSCRLPEGIRAPSNLHGPAVNLSRVRCRHQQTLQGIPFFLGPCDIAQRYFSNIKPHNQHQSTCLVVVSLHVFPDISHLFPLEDPGSADSPSVPWHRALRRGAHREATAMYLKSWHAYRPALTTLKMQVAMAVRPNTSSTAKRWTMVNVAGRHPRHPKTQIFGGSHNLWGG